MFKIIDKLRGNRKGRLKNEKKIRLRRAKNPKRVQKHQEIYTYQTPPFLFKSTEIMGDLLGFGGPWGKT